MEMKKRRYVYFGLFLLILILVVGLFIYHNNYSIALRSAGLSQKTISYLDTGFDDNGNEYRVVFSHLSENVIKIAHLTRDNLGIWHVTNTVSSSDGEAQYPYVVMGWMHFSGMRWYGVDGEIDMPLEIHNVYAGTNAKKYIEIPLELLPPNVSVDVSQTGSIYVIHFVSYGDGEALNQIDILELLDKTDCIAH